MSTTYQWSTPVNGKVWTTSPTGEAGQFDAEEFEHARFSGRLCGDEQGAISRFFWENF